MSIAQQIMMSVDIDNEYDAYAALTDELAVREENGITGADTDEIREAIEEQDERWAEESRAEIWAENAWLRYAEGGWDKTGEYSRELYEERW